jgi:hypothetical protein
MALLVAQRRHRPLSSGLLDDRPDGAGHRQARSTVDELLLFQTAYRTRRCGLTSMRTLVTDVTETRSPVRTNGCRHPRTGARSGIGVSLVIPTMLVEPDMSVRQDDFSNRSSF